MVHGNPGDGLFIEGITGGCIVETFVIVVSDLDLGGCDCAVYASQEKPSDSTQSARKQRRERESADMRCANTWLLLRTELMED